MFRKATKDMILATDEGDVEINMGDNLSLVGTKVVIAGETYDVTEAAAQTVEACTEELTASAPSSVRDGIAKAMREKGYGKRGANSIYKGKGGALHLQIADGNDDAHVNFHNDIEKHIKKSGFKVAEKWQYDTPRKSGPRALRKKKFTPRNAVTYTHKDHPTVGVTVVREHDGHPSHTMVHAYKPTVKATVEETASDTKKFLNHYRLKPHEFKKFLSTTDSKASKKGNISHITDQGGRHVGTFHHKEGVMHSHYIPSGTFMDKPKHLHQETAAKKPKVVDPSKPISRDHFAGLMEAHGFKVKHNSDNSAAVKGKVIAIMGHKPTKSGTPFSLTLPGKILHNGKHKDIHSFARVMQKHFPIKN